MQKTPRSRSRSRSRSRVRRPPTRYGRYNLYTHTETGCEPYQKQVYDSLCAIHSLKHAFDICVSMQEHVKFHKEFFIDLSNPKNTKKKKGPTDHWIEEEWYKYIKYANDGLDKPRYLEAFDSMTRTEKMQYYGDKYYFVDYITDRLDPIAKLGYYNYLIVEMGITTDFALYIIKKKTRRSPHYYMKIDHPKFKIQETDSVPYETYIYIHAQYNNIYLHEMDGFMVSVALLEYHDYMIHNVPEFREQMLIKFPLLKQTDSELRWKELENYIKAELMKKEEKMHNIAFRKNKHGNWCLVDSHGYVFPLNKRRMYGILQSKFVNDIIIRRMKNHDYDGY